MPPKEIPVIGAVIIRDGLVLCARRGPSRAMPGVWEFPGGKVEPGEAPRDALVREVEEELRCRIEVGDPVTTTRYEYDFGVVVLTTFICRMIEGEPRLTEHADLRWLVPAELGSLDWAPADVPAVDLVRHRYGDGAGSTSSDR